MRSKIGVTCIAILLILSLVVVSACGPSVPKEIEPCGIKLAGVYPLFLGQESVTYNLVFAVSNPNAIEVVLDTLEFRVSVEGQVLAQAQLLDDVYIPANKEVRITSAFTAPLASLVGEAFMSGGAEHITLLPKPMQEAIKSGEMDATSGVGLAAMISCLPLWKTLGAGLPIPDPAMELFFTMLWDEIPEKDPLFVVAGSASFLSAAGASEIEFESQWQAK